MSGIVQSETERHNVASIFASPEKFGTFVCCFCENDVNEWISPVQRQYCKKEIRVLPRWIKNRREELPELNVSKQKIRFRTSVNIFPCLNCWSNIANTTLSTYECHKSPPWTAHFYWCSLFPCAAAFSVAIQIKKRSLKVKFFVFVKIRFENRFLCNHEVWQRALGERESLLNREASRILSPRDRIPSPRNRPQILLFRKYDYGLISFHLYALSSWSWA